MSAFTVASLIAKGVPALSGVRATLVQARDALVRAQDAAPDLAASFAVRIADLDATIAVLDGVADPQRLVDLGITVVKELAALPKEGLKPSFHPGDVTGG